MKVDIYQSNSKPSKFLMQESGLIAEGITVRDDDFKSVKPYMKCIELEDGRFAINPAKAKEEIDLIGYYIYEVRVNVTSTKP